jgi:hypothetical protein
MVGEVAAYGRGGPNCSSASAGRTGGDIRDNDWMAHRGLKRWGRQDRLW